MNQINTILRRETKNTPHKDGKSKQTKSFQRRRNHKNKQKICEITYSNRIWGKTTLRGDFWVKIDPKSPVWQEDEEEKREATWCGRQILIPFIKYNFVKQLIISFSHVKLITFLNTCKMLKISYNLKWGSKLKDTYQ